MLPIRRADKTKVVDPSKRRAPRQERELAAALGGRGIPGSGSRVEKGDVRVRGVLRVEAKCTRKKSFSITEDMLDKIENAATLCSPAEIPAVHVEMLTPDGKPIRSVYVLRQDDFEDIMRRLRDAGS